MKHWKKTLALTLTLALLLGGCGVTSGRPAREKGNEKKTETATEPPEHRYDFVEDACPWTEAQAKAREAGGRLARLETEAELERVVALIGELGLEELSFRIGARREEDGEEYRWADGGDPLAGGWTDGFWGEGQPSFRWEDREETVVELYRDGDAWVLNDIPEEGYPGVRYGYIIEYE